MENLFIPIDAPELTIKDQIISEFSPTRQWAKNMDDGDAVGNLYDIEEITTISDLAMDENIELKSTHQGLQDWILANLPFTSIVQLYLIKALQDNPLHTDNTYTSNTSGPAGMASYDSLVCSEAYQAHRLANEPSGYRILISGNKGDGASKGFKCQDPDTFEIQYGTIPTDTDVFLIRVYDMLHGSDLETDETRLIVFVSGWLDEAAHANLIIASKTKYADYII